MNSTKNEARVGIVVVLGLVVMVAGYLFLRGLGWRADTYYMRLPGAANISTGCEVRLQGIRIGQVKDVTIDAVTQKPFLTLEVMRAKPPYRLLKTYAYTVQSNAVIGDSYVDIRGSYSPSAPLYKADDRNDVILAGNSIGIADVGGQVAILVKEMHGTLEKFNITVDRINKGVLSYDNQMKLTKALTNVDQLTERATQSFGPQGFRLSLGDPRAARGLDDTLANTAAAAAQARVAATNIRGLTTQLGGVVNENRGQIHGLLINLSRASNNIAGLTDTLNFLLQQGGLKENARIAFQSMAHAAQNIEAGSAGFRALANPSTQQSVRDTVTALHDASESLRATALTVQTDVADPETQKQIKDTLATLHSTLSDLNDIAVDLKKVLGDPQVQSDMKAIPAELRGTLTATRSTAERVNSLLGGRSSRNSTSQMGGARAQQEGYSPGGLDFTYRYLSGFRGAPRAGSDVSGNNYGDLTYNAEFFGAPFRLGLANIGDGTGLTAQSGLFLGRAGAVRYGLYRSKLGAGADYHLGRFGIEGNLWDPNNHSANLYLGFELTPKLELLAGREDIGGVRANALGVRLTP